jgi:hypothetical protein
MIKERPILYSTDMVKATTRHLKRMTRREISQKKWIINDEPDRYKFHGLDDNGSALFEDLKPEITPWMEPIPCPYGKAGDLLWVRESFAISKYFNGLREECFPIFKADHEFPVDWNWKPSIHMPKLAARIWLQIESISVQRVQSKKDAELEGIERKLEKKKSGLCLFYKDYCNRNDWYWSPVASFMSLWQKINGRDSWILNPWVWVITFNVLSTTGKPSTIPSGFKTKNSVKRKSLKSSPSGTMQPLAIEATPAPGNGEGKEVAHG